MVTSRRITTTLAVFLCSTVGLTSPSVAAPADRSAATESTHFRNLELELAPSGPTGLLTSLRVSSPRGSIPADAPRWQRLQVEPGDSLVGLLQDAGVQSDAWYHVLAAGPATAALKSMRSGDRIAIKHDASGRLLGLRYAYTSTKTLVVTRNGETLDAYVERTPIDTRREIARGTVHRSLARALTNAEVPATIATQLAHIFKPRLDLSRAIAPGAKFHIMYRMRYSDGQRLGSGPVIAAIVTTRGERYAAFRARNQYGEVGYYDRQGHAYARSIMRTPVDYQRVSSPFSPSRVNPVTGELAPHEGVDLAASMGTPIRAAADGTVEFAAWMSGYGRLVKIEHFGPYSTRYAHLSEFADGLSEGEHVEQGEIIGYVGASGRATGPHLHYEIRVNGQPHDPMSMDLPAGRQLAEARLDEFQQRATKLVAELGRPQKTRFVSLGAPAIGPSCRQAMSVNVPLARSSSGDPVARASAGLFCVGDYQTRRRYSDSG